MKNLTGKLSLLTALFAMMLSACANPATATPAPAEQSIAPEGVIAEGRLIPVHAVNLSFQARGSVEEINVQIGDSVKKGDLLARLSNADVAVAQLALAKAELVAAQQAVDGLNRNGPANQSSAWTAYLNAQIRRADAEREWEDLDLNDIEDRVDDAKAVVEDREADLQEARNEFDKYKDLNKDNSRRKSAENALENAQEEYNEALRDLDETMRERDTVRAALDSAIASEAEAKYQYEASVEGVNKDQLALATARLESAEAQVTGAEANLSNYILVAPFDGVVAEVNVEVGEQVSPEIRAVSVMDASSWMIETTDITELEVVKLETGQSVTFVADALPGVTMRGEVAEISQASYMQGGDVMYTVRIRVEQADSRVRWGMTVEILFESLE